MIKIYRAVSFGEPVTGPRPELGEKLPIHADSLRYDLGFHKPNDPSLVIFPVFTGKAGKTPHVINHAKWRSHSIMLYETHESLSFFDDWITYRHPLNQQGQPQYTQLVPVTLKQFIEEHKMKLTNKHR